MCDVDVGLGVANVGEMASQKKVPSGSRSVVIALKSRMGVGTGPEGS